MHFGPSPGNTVIASTPGPTPLAVASDVHGEPTSSSAKQNDSLPGLPCVARSTPTGRPPPTVRLTSAPATPTALVIPMALGPGPLHRMTAPTGIVVASTPWMLNSSVQTVSTMDSTQGRYSGLQPAITALMATFSTVTSTRSGGTVHTTSSGA